MNCLQPYLPAVTRISDFEFRHFPTPYPIAPQGRPSIIGGEFALPKSCQAAIFHADLYATIQRPPFCHSCEFRAVVLMVAVAGRSLGQLDRSSTNRPGPNGAARNAALSRLPVAATCPILGPPATSSRAGHVPWGPAGRAPCLTTTEYSSPIAFKIVSSLALRRQDRPGAVAASARCRFRSARRGPPPRQRAEEHAADDPGRVYSLGIAGWLECNEAATGARNLADQFPSTLWRASAAPRRPGLCRW